MKAFDIVEAVVTVKTEELGDSYELQEDRLEILEDYCNVIDMILAEPGNNSVSADVVSKHNFIVVTITLPCFTISDNFLVSNKEVCDLIERCVCFAVGHTKDGRDDIRIDFTFPSVWERN